jgi:carbon monoxide dehydrogenase subunit G
VEIAGTRRFEASRERVFEALTDPYELSGLVPGVERVEVASEDEWVAIVRPPFGRGFNLKLDMHVTDRRADEHARLIAWGKSLGARISIATEFELIDDDGGTEMDWMADVGLAGLLAGVGGRALEPVVRREAERALDRLAEHLESG